MDYEQQPAGSKTFPLFIAQKITATMLLPKQDNLLTLTNNQPPRTKNDGHIQVYNPNHGPTSSYQAENKQA